MRPDSLFLQSTQPAVYTSFIHISDNYDDGHHRHIKVLHCVSKMQQLGNGMARNYKD